MLSHSYRGWLRGMPAYEKLMLEAEPHPVCGGITSPERSRQRQGYILLNNQTGRKVLAHRVVWEEHHGPIPDGLCVCHHCDQPDCYAIAHLFLGTIADNNADMVSKDRQARGARVNNAKLNREAAEEIRRRYRNGDGGVLAREYGVDHSTIMRIIHKKTWREAA